MTKKNTKTVNWSAFTLLEIKLELDDHPLFRSTYNQSNANIPISSVHRNNFTCNILAKKIPYLNSYSKIFICWCP